MMLGIPNCDSVKKAKVYLDRHQVPFSFRDVRQSPLSSEEWQTLLASDLGGELVNTKSPSFRRTGVAAASLTDLGQRLEVLLAEPTAMKRPAILKDGALVSVGFSEDRLAPLVEATV